jgi:hypothetical protein
MHEPSLLQPESLLVTWRLNSQQRQAMLEDLSQGKGSNHKKRKMESTAQITEEDSKLDEVVVSQAKKQHAPWTVNCLLLVQEKALVF